jgi:hypothetical protein
MNEQADRTERYRRASPWPVFVALGFALSELGIFVGIYPVAVAGLLLLAGSVAGILVESGYVADVWRPLAGLGSFFALLGVAVIGTQVAPTAVDVLGTVGDPGGVVGRGLAIAGAGVILLTVGVVGYLLE